MIEIATVMATADVCTSNPDVPFNDMIEPSGDGHKDTKWKDNYQDIFDDYYQDRYKDINDINFFDSIY